MKKRLPVLLALIVLLGGLLLSGISDSNPLVANTGVPDNATASSVNQTDNPLSANATITIIMTTPPLPEE